MKKVKFTLLDSQVVCRGKWYGCNGLYTGDGRAVFSAGAGKEKGTYYTKDGGHTWETIGDVLGKFHYLIRRDGSLFGVSTHNEIAGKVDRKQKYKPYVMGIRRAESFDALMNGEYEDDFAYTRVPELTGACGDSGNYINGVADHGIVELANGDLLVTMYGHFNEDKQPVTFFVEPTFQCRSWVVASRDGGRSFEYLSTVADMQTWPVGPNAEGYCEPDLQRLNDGRLLCVMRSGGAFSQGRGCFAPAFSATSLDGGMSWSKPVAVNDHGVFPRAVQTENGAVVMTAGRDGVYIAGSADLGESWQKALIVSRHGGTWGFSPSGYHSLGLVAPNEVLLIYDDVDETKKMPRPDSEAGKAMVKGSCHKMVANRYRVEMV